MDCIYSVLIIESKWPYVKYSYFKRFNNYPNNWRKYLYELYYGSTDELSRDISKYILANTGNFNANLEIAFPDYITCCIQSIEIINP